MAKLIPKSPEQKLSALEDHLHLLHLTLGQLTSGDPAHLRALAGQLRALVCMSAGLSGLLWRLRDELAVDDTVHIRYPGKVDKTKLYARGGVHVQTLTDVEVLHAVPRQGWALREHIREHEACFVDGTSLTHEALISRLANEAGTAHEADGISKDIAKLNSIRMGDTQSYFQVLATDARLVLEVGERIIQAGVASEYVRRRRAIDQPPPTAIQQVRFTGALELPQIDVQGNEGSILFLLTTDRIPTAGRLDELVRYPPSTSGRVTLFPEVTRRRRLRIQSSGLPLPHFGFETPLPGLLGDSLAVAITWNGMDVRGYVAGRLVSGIPADGTRSDQDPATAAP